MKIDELKLIADELGITYNNAIGVSTLTKRIEEHCNQNNIECPISQEPLVVDETIVEQLKVTTIPEIDKKLSFNKKDAERLVRVRITCNNPDKAQYTSDVFFGGNSKYHQGKCVQFNIETHVPQMILSIIDEKMYTQYTTTKVNGNVVTTAKQAKEFSIEYLTPIPQDEYDEIKHRQLANPRKSIED